MSKTRAGTGILDAILRFNQGRKPGLLRFKLRRLLTDSFTFFRGTDHLFCRAWPQLQPADTGPDILLCGDLHVENFGAYRTTEGDFRYDINDFDEALVAPCSFDLVRCSASIVLASELWKLTPSQATGMALAYLEHYRQALLQATRNESVGEIVPHGGHSPIQELLGSTVIANQAELLKAKTRRKADGRRVIRRTKSTPNITRKRFDKIAAALEAYGQHQGKPDAFRVHDLTFRIAGVGSLGIRRYLALVEGDGPPDGYRLLDIKEARPSAVGNCTAAPQPDTGGDQARRVVMAQKVLQGHVIAGLDVLKIGESCYRIREMIPRENRSSLNRFQKQPARLRKAVETAGRLTAWSHLRGGRYKPGLDQWPNLARWAEGPPLDAVLAAAARFTERTNLEHADFRRAVRDVGGVSACLTELNHANCTKST
jgi:uncharacterized protein (DUF2252 family)